MLNVFSIFHLSLPRVQSYKSVCNGVRHKQQPVGRRCCAAETNNVKREIPAVVRKGPLPNGDVQSPRRVLRDRESDPSKLNRAVGGCRASDTVAALFGRQATNKSV